MHRHCGPGDDDDMIDDDYDDSVLPKDCILYFPGAGFYCIGIVAAMKMILCFVQDCILFSPGAEF